MINAKVKVPSNAAKKAGQGSNNNSGLPLGSQAIKVTSSTPQGVSLLTNSLTTGQQASGANIGNHSKKISDSQGNGSRNGLNQSKFTNSAAAAPGGAGTGINLQVDKSKQTVFEMSRNQMGSRGRSLGGAQSPNGVAPRRNIQQFQMEQQQSALMGNGNGMMVQSVADNGANSLINGPSGKPTRNSRASSTNPSRPTLQTSMQQAQFQFDNSKTAGSTGGQMKNGKQFVNNSTSFSAANTPLSVPNSSMQMQSQAQAIKRIRDSRQRGNKSMQIGSQDPQNQLMQAYINQTVTMTQKQPEFVGPSGQIRATEPMRIRAHSDLKKTGIQIGVKIQGIQNSREHLNQTTILAGNPQNSSLSQGIQQFHTRGNSISGTNMGLGIPGHSQKRSQSVDKNAPHFAHFNQSQNFAPSAHFGPNQQQNVQMPQQQQQPQVGAANKDPKGGQHFIHDAIERKIERFSRQRNRGGLHMSQGASPAASVQGNVYAQPLVGYPNGNNVSAGSTLSNGNSKGNLNTPQNPNQPASRAFKNQQKLQQKQTVGQAHQPMSDDQAIFERQKKKAGTQPNATNPQGQILMRGEIMSAGQANLPQRNKMLGQNQVGTPTGEQEEPQATRNNNYLNTMLDGYSASNQAKKAQRGGTRGVPTGSTAQTFGKSGIQGAPTGPLLAQKVVQLPKQARTGPQAANMIETDEQKMIRAGKVVKNDRFKKDGGHDSPEVSKSGKLTIIEVDQQNHRSSPEKGEHRNKTKIAAAIQIQRQQQMQDEEGKVHTQQNPQLQGSQGQQILSKQPRKDKIAVISLTTAKIDVRNPNDKADSPQVHSEKQTMEPDEQAQLQGSKKRLGHPASESPRSQPDDYEQNSMRDAHKKRKHEQIRSNRTHSKGSVTVSMRDESIMHMSVNSVTDGNFILHEGDAQSHDSNDHFSIKKQMIRYLSRVADRNKPLFVFNQKLNLGGDSSDDDTGTPSFSLVALIEK